MDADTPYAEVEVMKMCMPLLSPASGVIHFKMSEGQAMQVILLAYDVLQYFLTFVFGSTLPSSDEVVGLGPKLHGDELLSYHTVLPFVASLQLIQFSFIGCRAYSSTRSR